MKIDKNINAKDLAPALGRFLGLATEKTANLDRDWNPAKGAPVFTREGKYTSRGWTEWTQGFQFGIQLLLFDATGDASLLARGRENTRRFMAPHVSHVGVHDHGFNNVSTYGNLRRLALEGKSGEGPEAVEYYDLALKLSGAIQASRWSRIADGTGYIHSFNGPHSLFSDTIRSCRALVVGDRLGHVLMAEGDQRVSLLERAMEHIRNTFRHNVYFGRGRDLYDVPGRVVHESIFNMADGQYRCPSTQQGYSPFSTWTRGLAWIVLGAAEQLEFFSQCLAGEHGDFEGELLEAARATADFHIANSAADGIPFWDTGAPGVIHFPGYTEKPSQPDNEHEPFDSSAAAITAQGLLRLGRHLGTDTEEGSRYWQAGLTTARTLFDEPYLSTDTGHHGLILHSVYHRPNNWDHIPGGKRIPMGESSMWGDYHAVELAVYLDRIIKGDPYYTFFS